MSRHTSQNPSLTINNFMDFESFFDIFISNLGQPHFEILLQPHFTDICSGWKQDTFKQVSNKMTKNGSILMPLIFNSVAHMQCISNKNEALKGIFNHLNQTKLDRIDS